MARKMRAENERQIRRLVNEARTCGPKLRADECLSQLRGIAGYALVAGHLTESQHATLWAEINEITEARAMWRTERENTHA